jgi:hypothetical protein
MRRSIRPWSQGESPEHANVADTRMTENQARRERRNGRMSCY